MFFRCKRSHGIEYLQLVRCDRVEGRPRQSVLATLGRTADLARSGAIDRMLQSAARLSKSVMAVTMSNSDSATLTNCRHIGLALVFEQLWHDAGCARAVDLLASRFRLAPDFERIVWSQTLEQQIHRRCDCAGKASAEAQLPDGYSPVDAADLERISDLLENDVPTDRSGPRRLKEELEELIFFQQARQSRHLTLVLLREEQAVAAGVVDGCGKIICCDAWPDDSFIGAELRRMTEKLRKRFRPEQIAVVTDPGVVDDETRALLDECGIRCRFGPDLLVPPALRLNTAAGPDLPAGTAPKLGMVVCNGFDRTGFAARADDRVREAFGPVLRDFVQYESGSQSKAALRSRIFFAFLGLRMREELENRLAANGHVLPWGALMDDLKQMLEFEFEYANERYVLRTPPSNRAKSIFAILGIAPLPLIEPLAVSRRRLHTE